MTEKEESTYTCYFPQYFLSVNVLNSALKYVYSYEGEVQESKMSTISELDVYNREQQASWSPVPLNVGMDCGDACQERGVEQTSGVPSTSAPMYSFLNTLENNRHDFYIPCCTDMSVFELCKVKHLYP